MTNTIFTIQLAHTSIEVCALHPMMQDFFSAYLHNDAHPRYTIKTHPSDITAEKIAWKNQCKMGKNDGIDEHHKPNSKHAQDTEPDTQFVSEDSLEALALCRKICDCLFEQDILLFHGSALCIDGKAILFAAKSGTGKSTHARLWRELLGSRVQMLNDDKPFLKISPSSTTVFGSPWDGKHHLSKNTSAPLKAICFLAQGRHNSIRQIDIEEACVRLIEQTHIPNPSQDSAHKNDALLHTLELLDILAKQVIFYELTCLPNIEAAKLAYETICNCEGRY